MACQQKTPPDGEKGGEKQYKDYEKNPTLFFLNASASKSDAKISIIFIHGTLLDIFLENFLQFLSHQGTKRPLPSTLEPCSRASNHCLAAMTN
jgi:hypothetical protein